MATKKKALKKSKLRHAEYYDFQKIQDKLYAESMDGKMFTKLVEIITLPENIKLAYRNIKKNKGSKTAGTDGKTIPKSDFVMRKCPQAYSRYRYRHYCKAYGFLKPHSETENQS